MIDDSDYELGAYYQTSDDVPAHVIQEFTQYCSNPDCRISARISMTTLAGALAGVSSHYNRDGQKVIEDRNRKAIVLCCITCTRMDCRNS